MTIESAACLLEFCPPAEAQRLAAAAEAGKARETLSAAELDAYRALAAPKRRLDWLAGRLAAKKALRLRLSNSIQPPSLAGIEIFNDASGKPFCRVPEPCRQAARRLSFSISHCAQGGLCAVVSGPAVGVDWEIVAPRAARLLEMVLHPTERRPASPLEETRIWTLKEAVLKLLGLGLSCDPTEIRFENGLNAELYGAAWSRWREMGAPPIRCETRQEGPAVLSVAYA